MYKIANQIKRECINKVNQDDHTCSQLFISSMVAGAIIGLGCLTTLCLNSGALVSGLIFPLALALVAITQTDLFTGSNLIVYLGICDKSISVSKGIQKWIIIFLGNLCGSALFVFLLSISGLMTPAGLSAAIEARQMITATQLFCRGVLCNILVCLAIALFAVYNRPIEKIIIAWLCILPFIVCGFEHSVADMTILLLGLVNGVIYLPQAALILLWVTLGNIVGGSLIVGNIVLYNSK